MGTNFKKVTYSVAMLFLSLVCHSVGYSQQVSKTVNYTAAFQPFGEGIRKTFALPSEVDPENHFQVGFMFDLKPEEITANITATLIFDQGNETLQIRGKDGELQSQGGINLQAFVKVACELPPIPFATTEPVFVEVEIPFSISNFLNAKIHEELPSIGLPPINALDGWDTSQSFNSLLFNGTPVELRGGIRELVRAELQATDIVEAIIGAVTTSVGVPLPRIALKVLGKAFEIALGNAAISYNLGFLSTLTLTGQSITVNGEQLMSEDQIIKAPGLDLSADTYTVDSSYEEQFTYQLDFVASSDVWLEFNPLGIPVWSYPKTVIAEFPSALIPKQEVNLNFTSSQTTFPLTEALPAASLVAVEAIDHRLLLVDGPSQTVDMAPYFSTQSSLIYEVSSSPSGVVTESVSGSRVTIAPLQVGNTSVIVTAFDRNDEHLYAIQTIPVLVYTNRATIVRPPSSFTAPETSNFSAQGLAKGVSVIVQNTNELGINIRSNPWVSNNNPDNRIGNVHDGATGTITDGPESNGGFTWWKIDWDLENKVGWSAEVVQGSQLLFPRPPDLEIRDFDVSDDDVKPGEEFRLEAEIRNNGPGKSEPTEIYFYYQASDEEDVRVAGKGKVEVPSLRKDERREVFLTVTAPMTPHTDYDYGAILPPDIPETYDAELVDPTRQLRLNNIAEVVRVEVSSAPDLIVESISVRDGEVTLTPGEAFTLEATVRNQGIGEPERNATLHYYRSWDASISTRDTEVGTDTVSSGNLGTSETEDESIRLTAPTEPGIYYYGACVDLRYESDTDNNCSGSVAITVRETRRSDLVVSLLPLSDNTLAPGASFTLQATVQNQGIGTARPTILRSYRSANASISPNDTEVGSVDVSSLSADETEIQAFTLNAPLAASTYYYGASIESVSNESNTANNYSTGVALRVENLAPVTVDPIPAETLAVEDLFVKVDLSLYFSDPNSDVLTYAVESAAPEIVKVDLSGVSSSILRMMPLAAGDATITVEVSDGEFTATQTIDVSVTAPNVLEEVWMPDANLRAVVRAALGLAEGDVLTQEVLQDLTELDASVALDAPTSVMISSLIGLEHATQLTVLDLGHNNIIDVSPLSGLRQLTVLDLWANEVVNISPLSELTQLASLYISYNGFTDVSPLSALTQLTTLDLENNNIIDVSALSGLTQLTELYLGWNNIIDVSGLSSLTQLTNLDLTNNAIIDVSALSGLTQLTELTLYGNDIIDVSALSGLTQLTELDLWGNDIIDVSPLSGLTQLTWLSLISNKVIDISPLSGLTQLTVLYLSGNEVVDVSALEGLINLEELFLEGNPISDFAPLRRLKAKNPDVDIDIDISVVVTAVSEETWMPDANLREAVREALDLAPGDVLTQEVLQRLTKLDASLPWGAPVSVKASDLTGIEHATQLTSLGLGTNKVVDVSPLSGLTQLTRLDLSYNDIVDISVLSGLTQLTSLDLGGNDIVDISVLSGLTQLTLLYLWGNEGVDIGPLVGLTQLTSLNLRYNDIVDISVLSGLTQLTSLDLGLNDIVDISILSGLTQLTWLDLGGNDIVDISPLVGLTQLTSLELQDNQISDVSALEGLINLEELFLEGNPVTDLAPLRRLKSKNPGVYIDIDISVVATVVSEETWMPDANLREAVRAALSLAPGDVLTQQAMQDLTELDASLPLGGPASVEIGNLTGLEHATQLTSLDLGDNDIIDVSVLSGLTQLTELYLGGNDIIDISVLSGLTQLTSLDLWGNDIIDVSVLSGLTQLTWLSLNGNFAVSDVSPLSSLTQLTELYLMNTKIVDISPLSRLTQLTTLNFRFCDVSDVSPLSSLTQLTELDLTHNEVSDVSPLSGLTQLTWLSLEGNKVIDISPLSGLTQLTELFLGDNEIVDISALSGLTQLTWLDLIDNEVVDVSPLEGLINLEELFLEGNPISDFAPLRRLKAKNPDMEIDIDISIETPVISGGTAALHVYWTLFGHGEIQRSNLDGTSVRTLFTKLGYPVSIAVDVAGGKIYWAINDFGNGDGNKIQRANLDGTNIQDIVTNELLGQTYIALDVAGGKIYWTNDNYSGDGDGDKIQCANLDGTNVQDIVTEELSYLNGIALDVTRKKIYWTQLYKIQRSNLDGTNVQDIFANSGGYNLFGIALDVAGGKVYWGNPSKSKIQRANLDGSNVQDFITGVEPRSIALDVAGGKVYWINPSKSKIQRANLDGSNVEDIVTGVGDISDIALGIFSQNPPPVVPVVREDVNRDGVIDLQDTAVVRANLGQTGQNDADVNDDNVVDVDDLVLVLAAIENAAAAPTTHTQIQQLFTTKEVQQWLTEAQLSEETSPAYLRGITMLEQILALLIPQETVLLANYPNPFNPETWIPYQLSKPADVTMSIYSVDGRLVRTLALGYQSAGVYRSRNRAAYWDGRNNVGERVASGIYFYTFTAGSFTATRKMLIRK